MNTINNFAALKLQYQNFYLEMTCPRQSRKSAKPTRSASKYLIQSMAHFPNMDPIISRDKDHIQIVKIIFCSKAKDNRGNHLQNSKHTKAPVWNTQSSS